MKKAPFQYFFRFSIRLKCVILSGEMRKLWEVSAIRTGIYGGSFDPPHEGHLLVAMTALEAAGLDRVLLLPCGDIPCAGRIKAPAADRVRMLELMTDDCPELTVCPLEAEKKERTPTAKTMKALKKLYPEDELFFILGADKLEKLPEWKHAEKLFALCSFLALPRDGLPTEELAKAARRVGASVTVLPMRQVTFSSAAIQEELADYREPNGLSRRVAAYIAENGLYHDPDMEKRVREMMTEKRFRHTLGVRKQAVELAEIHHIPLQKAALAALLHDCAKCLPFEEMQAVARSGGVSEEGFFSSPEMLHGPAGAVLAKREFGVTDEDVLNAITYHTMGRADMSPLELCVFIADATEPGRRDYPGLQRIRRLSRESLPAAALLSLERTRDYVLEQGKTFNPLSEKTIAWLQSAQDGFDRKPGI